MNEASPLTGTEVRGVILAFWRLNADKAPVSEFVPILDDGFAIVAVNPDGEEIARFDGLSGLEEHQAGKEVYFDQRFTLRSFHVEIQVSVLSRKPRDSGSASTASRAWCKASH